MIKNYQLADYSKNISDLLYLGFYTGYNLNPKILSSTIHSENIEEYNESMDRDISEEMKSFQNLEKNVCIDDYLKYSNKYIEMGDEIDLTPIKNIRNLINYDEKCFSQIESKLTLAGKKKLLYELAQIDFNALCSFEIDFVIKSIKEENIELQEFALNTLEIWNNKDLILKIGTVEIKDKYLQAEYEALTKM